MRKNRGTLFILVGVALALMAGYMVASITRQAAANAAAQAQAVQPVKKVYVVVAKKDLAENAAISSDDVAQQEIEADFAPPGAIASPDIAVGKYPTTRVYQGEILVAPLLAENKQSGALASLVPEGKVAMAVTISDSMNALGVLRPGDRVDLILSLDMGKVPQNGLNPNLPTQLQAQAQAQTGDQLVAQLTMQNIQILSIGAPVTDTTTNTTNGPNQPNGTAAPPAQPAAQSRTLTFLLDHQDAVTLKYIKDSGGTLDMVLRGPNDTELAKTEAVGIDTVYKQFQFRFVQPVNR